MISKLKFWIKKAFRFKYFDRYKLFWFDDQRKVVRSRKEKRSIIFSRRNVIPFMDLDVTTYCNLRCRRCGKCTPYFENKRHISAAEIEQNLSLLTKYVDKIYYASIIGGEPFLNPELPEIIEIAAKCDKIERLELTTNGTVVPSDELLRAIKESGLAVHISRYPGIAENLTANRIKLEERLKEYGIFYEHQFQENWLDFGEIEKRGHKRGTLVNMLLNCPMNVCTVFNGKKLYRCGKASYISQHGIEKDDDGVIDLDEVTDKRDMRKKLKKFFGCKRLSACAYCEASPATITAGEQIGDEKHGV
ncbi:MAG: radical SAM protein [Clostridiales bacterium]|nr:radical SAM protein [Clostridiales bacterium]